MKLLEKLIVGLAITSSCISAEAALDPAWAAVIQRLQGDSHQQQKQGPSPMPRSQSVPQEILRVDGANSTSATSSENGRRLQTAFNAIVQSNVAVTDAKGGRSNAWAIVSEFANSLNTQTQAYQEADADTKEHLNKIFRSLLKREVGSAKILGRPGTGKTFLVKQMMGELIAGKGPESLLDTVFLQVDPSGLAAGNNYVGSFETKINAMIALSRAYKIVWVIDEAHAMKGSGTSEKNSNDGFQMLKPGLTEGFIRVVAMSTDHEWNEAFVSDPAFNDRFGEIKLSEPVGKALQSALNGFVKKHSFPDLDPEVLALITRLSSEFNAEGAQPRKGTLLIEELFAEQELKGVGLHSPNIDEVKAAAQRLYNLNSDHFDHEKMQARLRAMPTILSEKIIGQMAAKQAIVDSFEMAMAGVEDKSKPKGRKIFAGPPGQGKTQLAFAAAAAMDIPFVRIVMTKYTSPAQTDELKREIAQALRRNAKSILFFDEIEKAHLSVQNDLLDLLDNGNFSIHEKTAGRSSVVLDINVRNAYVYMATNAGAGYIDSIKNQTEYDVTEMRRAMDRDGLSRLVLDRMDGIVPFFYLTIQEYRQVIFREVRNILKVYKENNPDVILRLENFRGFIDQTVLDTFREKMSNREAIGALSADLRLKIARAANASSDPTKVNAKLDGSRAMKSQDSRHALLCDGLFLN